LLRLESQSVKRSIRY